MEYVFPFRVGIIGHRSLTEIEKDFVQKEIGKTLVTLERTIEGKKKTYAIKSSCYISGITSLAEGAERVFAREVLANHGSIEVILPFSKEIYMQDFWGDESREEFLYLFKFDKYPIINDSSASPNKTWAYYATSKHIIDQCDFLLAVWDETPVKAKTGGTEYWIEYAAHKKVPTIIIPTKPSKSFEKENKANLELLKLQSFNQFDKEWKPHTSNKKNTKARKNDVLNPDKFKNILPESEFAKINHLFNIYDYWNEKARRFIKEKRRLTRIGYFLAVLVMLTGLSAYASNHCNLIQFESTNPIIKNTLKLSQQQIDRCISFASGSINLLLTTEACLAFIMLLLLVRLLKLAGNEDLKEAVIWSVKIRFQILKILCLKNASELLDNNSNIDLLISKSLNSRLFLVSSKEIWNNFENTLDFTVRTSIVQEYLKSEIAINNREKEEGIPVSRWSVFFYSLTALSMGYILLFHSRNYLNPYLENMPDLRELMQISGLVFATLGLIIEGWMKIRISEAFYDHKSGASKKLKEVYQISTELCNSEEDLEFILRKTEAIILSVNPELNKV